MKFLQNNDKIFDIELLESKLKDIAVAKENGVDFKSLVEDLGEQMKKLLEDNTCRKQYWPYNSIGWNNIYDMVIN